MQQSMIIAQQLKRKPAGDGRMFGNALIGVTGSFPGISKTERR